MVESSRSSCPISHTDPTAVSARQRHRDIRRTGTTIAARHRRPASPTLNAFRVVLTQQALADAADADRKRAAGRTTSAARHSRSRSRTTSTSRACRPGSVQRATCGRPPQTPRSCAGCARPARSSSARPTPASWVSGRSPAGRPSVTPSTRGRASTRRAARRAAARPRWPPAWWPRRSAPTARAASGFPRRGRIWSASSRSAGASPPGRCPRRSTASRSTGCWPAPSPMRRWCWTRPPATSTAICTSRRRCGCPTTSAARPGR